MTFDDAIREWRRQGAATDNYLAGDDGVEHRAVATIVLAERRAAHARAAHHDMDLTIESEFSPTILTGTFRGHRFWYYERQGDWELRLDGAGGPVIAESATSGLADVVDLIVRHLARHDAEHDVRRTPDAPEELRDARRLAIEAVEDEPWDTWW